MSSERRLHPYSIFFAFLTQLRLFVVPGVLLALGVGRGDDGWWRPWMMLLVLPTALGAVLRYVSYRYEYGESELVIRSGLFIRRERHIPYDRIQNIDAVQNVLHRLLRVVEVRVETGGGNTAEATMSVLPMTAFAEMRERVFANRRSTAAESAPADGAVTPPVLELSVRELLLCGLLEGRGAVLLAAGFGVLWEFEIFGRFIPGYSQPSPFGRDVVRSAAREVFTSVEAFVARIGLAILAALVLLLLLRVVSMAWAVVRLYGFRLQLIDSDARSEFGLLTKVAQTIPLRRIQSLTVREGPLHRWFRRAAVRVDTAGGKAGDDEGGTAERESLAPIIAAGRVPDLVDRVIDVDLAAVDWQPPHPRGFRREVIAWLIVAAVISIPLLVAAGWPALLLLPLLGAWALLAARQTIKHLRWAETDDAVLLRRGWLWRRIMVVRVAKIQVVTLHESPFDRRHGMASVHVDTAGASGGSIVHIPYLGRDLAAALHERLTMRAAETKFTW